MEKPSHIKVTQLQAASSQLDTAIELWVLDKDPISIHSLCFAAHQIVHDINRKKKGRPLLMDSPLIPKERQQEFVNAVKHFPNYFKHADNRGKKKNALDAQKVVFDPYLNELFFIFTIGGLIQLGEKITNQQHIFYTWAHVHRPHLFTEAWNQYIQEPTGAKAMLGLKAIDKQEFFKLSDQVIRGQTV
jgi:hypothetical protein